MTTVMIANSDQYVDLYIDTCLQAMRKADGLVMTMPGLVPIVSNRLAITP